MCWIFILTVLGWFFFFYVVAGSSAPSTSTLNTAPLDEVLRLPGEDMEQLLSIQDAILATIGINSAKLASKALDQSSTAVSLISVDDMNPDIVRNSFGLWNRATDNWQKFGIPFEHLLLCPGSAAGVPLIELIGTQSKLGLLVLQTKSHME